MATIMWPPPPDQCQLKAKGLFAQPICCRTWSHVRAVLLVRENVKPYLSNSGQPPWTQAEGTELFVQSVRPNSLFASTPWLTLWPRKSMTIWPLAAQHHMLVSWGWRVTTSSFCAGGVHAHAPSESARMTESAARLSIGGRHSGSGQGKSARLDGVRQLGRTLGPRLVPRRPGSEIEPAFVIGAEGELDTGHDPESFVQPGQVKLDRLP